MYPFVQATGYNLSKNKRTQTNGAFPPQLSSRQARHPDSSLRQIIDELKEELIKLRTSASEQRRLHQLLIAEELGDRKPTQLLRRMRQLLGDHILEESILKQLFLQRLPTNAQLILAPTSDTVSIDQLAIVADKIMEVTPSANQIATAAVLPNPTPEVSETTDLRKKIDQLTKQVHALESRLRSRSKQRSSSRDNRFKKGRSRERRPNSPITTPHEGNDCWYHWRYGDKAHKCTQPCSYNKRENDDANN